MASMSKADIGRLLARQGILIAFAVFIIGFTLANVNPMMNTAKAIKMPCRANNRPMSAFDMLAIFPSHGPKARPLVA